MRWHTVTWALLLLLALFPVVFPVLDVIGIVRSGIPSDHIAACCALAGQDFGGVQVTSPQRYIQQLEV